MIPYQYVGAQGDLRREEKLGWRSDVTTGPKLFIHGGPMLPGTVKNFGLTPEKAGEYLVHANDVVDATTGALIHKAGSTVGSGKAIFAFFFEDGTAPTSPRVKPAAVNRLWGVDGHTYLFKVPAGTTYWSQNGTITNTAEVAFEYLIEPDDIVEYWAPSENYISAPGQPRNPRANFQVAPFASITK